MEKEKSQFNRNSLTYNYLIMSISKTDKHNKNISDTVKFIENINPIESNKGAVELLDDFREKRLDYLFSRNS